MDLIQCIYEIKALTLNSDLLKALKDTRIENTITLAGGKISTTVLKSSF